MALKFAARSRSKECMRKYLKMMRESGLGMSSNVYRSVIAKFSIGHRGLGEIRNGRWKRSDLREFLLGFEGCDDLLKEEQYHFGAFLDRDDWQYLHGWVAVLARCRESEAIWEEWLLWRKTKAYKEPRMLVVMGEENVKRTSPTITMTSKLRGVYWFVEQMVFAGDIEKAWCILKETGVSCSRLKQSIKVRMLDEPEHFTTWDNAMGMVGAGGEGEADGLTSLRGESRSGPSRDDLQGMTMQEELLNKYDADLARIEQALGVVWKAGTADGEGRHELYMDQEEALDRLVSERWKWNEQNGYPWEEESPIISQSERELHDAEES